jgi:hypothetical protein
MDVVVGYVLPLAAFTGIYAALHAKARREGKPTTVQWRWLGAILLCAGSAMLLGALL